MNTFLKGVLIFVISIVVGGFAVGFIVGVKDAVKEQTPVRTESTSQASAATFKNSFVSGCANSGGDYAACGCIYDSFLAMYPDFSTNTERMNRILAEGYNPAETDAAIHCVVVDQT